MTECRRHWRVDSKWLFGIPATFFLALVFALTAMLMVSGREQGQGLIAGASEQLLIDPNFRQDMQQFAPNLLARMDSPDFDAYLYENPDAISREVEAVTAPAQPLPEGAEAPDSRQGAGAVQGTLSIYSLLVNLVAKPVHDGVGPLLTVALVLLLATGIPFMVLSYRMGRLVSAGVACALASLPALILLKLLSAGIAAKQPEGGVEPGSEAVISMIKGFSGESIAALSHYYVIYTLVAASLFAAAGVGYAAVRVLGAKRSRVRLSTEQQSPRPA
ncbi:MAG: hypothetical protein C4534_09755 [Gaiellales bacterium]|nr:MAG: hypothetical protein C4534_09755 [Gaiellales bacterium]